MTNEGRPNFMMVEATSPVEVWLYGGKAELVYKPSDNSKIYTGIDTNIIKRKGDRTRIVKKMNGMPLPQPKIFVDKIWQDANLNDVGLFVEGKFKIADFTTLTTGVRSDFISNFQVVSFALFFLFDIVLFRLFSLQVAAFYALPLYVFVHVPLY